MEKSRLKYSLERKARRNILLTSLGIVAIVIFLIILGPKLLIGMGLLAGSLSKNDNYTSNVNQESSSYVAPPTLNSPTEATNSAAISLSGSASSQQSIKLYNNGNLVDKKQVEKDNTFKFTDVTLKDGSNSFTAKAVTDDNKESTFSNEVRITRLDKAPKLEISSPSEGQTFKKEASPITVKGTTDPNVKVTVNSFWAIVNDQGSFTYTYNLQSGDNTLKIEATDQANNKTTKEVKIHVD